MALELATALIVLVSAKPASAQTPWALPFAPAPSVDETYPTPTGDHRVREWRNAEGKRIASLGTFKPTVASASPPCVPNPPYPTTLCLWGGTGAGQFKIEVYWWQDFDRDGIIEQGENGPGYVSDQSDGTTGIFWFFASFVPELFVKIPAACGYPPRPRYWVFVAGLTDVGVAVVVNNTATGERWEFWKERGVAFPPVQDTDAFSLCDYH